MPRFKLILEYDGESYKGWQVHKSERSIMGEPFEIYGAELRCKDTTNLQVWQLQILLKIGCVFTQKNNRQDFRIDRI